MTPAQNNCASQEDHVKFKRVWVATGTSCPRWSISNVPTNQLHVGTLFRRLVRSLSLRPSWLLASWIGPRFFPQPSSGLYVRAFSSSHPEDCRMRPAPNGPLRRQDFHL